MKRSKIRGRPAKRAMVWHCYIDGELYENCRFVFDEDGGVWPFFDSRFRPWGEVALVYEKA